MHSRVSTRSLALALLLTTAACTTWTPYQVAPTREDLPSTIRVTLDSGEQKRLSDPFVQIVEGDTLIAGRGHSGDPVWRTSLRDVQKVESGSVDGSRTAVTALSIAGAGAAAVLLILWHQCEHGGGCE